MADRYADKGDDVIPLAAIAVLGQTLSAGQPSETVRWAVCGNGQPADLRTDIPVLVLDAINSPDLPDVPLWTGFVLYANGRIIARRAAQMIEWQAEEGRAQAFWNEVSGDQLFAMEGKFEPLTPHQGEQPRRGPHDWIPETLLHMWKDGCHTRIRVRGLNQLVASDLVNRRHFLNVSREELQHARATLAALPSVLSNAIRRMLAYTAKNGKTWCKLGACFSSKKKLDHHELWEAGPP